jgi:hypothetical protein
VKTSEALSACRNVSLKAGIQKYFCKQIIRLWKRLMFDYFSCFHIFISLISLDSRLRGNDNLLRHTHESGYLKKFIIKLRCDNEINNIRKYFGSLCVLYESKHPHIKMLYKFYQIIVRLKRTNTSHIILQCIKGSNISAVCSVSITSCFLAMRQIAQKRYC